jgi:hypothetical protein
LLLATLQLSRKELSLGRKNIKGHPHPPITPMTQLTQKKKRKETCLRKHAETSQQLMEAGTFSLLNK